MRGYPRNRLTDRSGSDPVVRKTTRSRGFTISYDDAGAGPAIVLIPGATMNAGDWRDAGYVDRLVGRYRVLSVDPLGLGHSDKPHDPDAYLWPTVALDTLAVIDDADVDRAVLWGYSRGGDLAAALAAERPDRVSGLVLHDGSPAPVAPDSDVPPHVEALSRGDFGMMWERYGFTDDDRRHDQETNDPRALGALWAGLRRSGIATDLRRIVAPTLIIEGGEDDPEIAAGVGEALGVTPHILPGLDHLQSFSRIDLVMPLVLEFLESLGVQPPG